MEKFQGSVTQVIAKTKQPYSGYLKPSDFKDIFLENKEELHLHESVPPTLMGLVVDYLARFCDTNDYYSSFQISLQGAMLALKEGLSLETQRYLTKKEAKEVLKYLKKEILGTKKLVQGLDEESIHNAFMLVSFDSWFRSDEAREKFKNPLRMYINNAAIKNVCIMVKRSLDFFKVYGPVLLNGIYYKKENTGKYIITGDGDFATKRTLWDFKVSKLKTISSKHTLQLLIYYLMDLKSEEDRFQEINKLAIFNPRLNKISYYKLENIEEKTVLEVCSCVIGFDNHTIQKIWKKILFHRQTNDGKSSW